MGKLLAVGDILKLKPTDNTGGVRARQLLPMAPEEPVYEPPPANSGKRNEHIVEEVVVPETTSEYIISPHTILCPEDH